MFFPNPEQRRKNYIYKQAGVYKRPPASFEHLNTFDPRTAWVIHLASTISTKFNQSQIPTIVTGGLGFVAACRNGQIYREHSDIDLLVHLNARDSVQQIFGEHGNLWEGGGQFDAVVPGSFFDYPYNPKAPSLHVDIAFYNQYADGTLNLSQIGIDGVIDGSVLHSSQQLLGRHVYTFTPDFAWYARNLLNVGRPKDLVDLNQI